MTAAPVTVSGTAARRFGGYITEKVLGQGGMGTVYQARHPTLGKRVALKSIRASLADDPVARQRFLREARAIALISHPHVVDVFDLRIDDERVFMVMELLEGETLDALLAREQRLALSRTVDLLLPVISAAAAIHDAGLVHRDLKPGNVMLAQRGRGLLEPVILDFGISRFSEAPRRGPAITERDQLVGTIPYLAPELLRDARAAGPRSDQYAVGVMLYECVTGRQPFVGADRYEQIQRRHDRGCDAAQPARCSDPGRARPHRAARPQSPPGAALSIDARAGTEPALVRGAAGVAALGRRICIGQDGRETARRAFWSRSRSVSTASTSRPGADTAAVIAQARG